MAVQEVSRRIGVSIVGIAAAAALVAGCSSSGGNPSTTTSSGGGASSTSSGGGAGTSSSSSSSGGDGGAVLGNAFCAGFKNSDLQGLSNATSAAQVVKAWDQYAKDAPSEIKSSVQDIDHYLHVAADKNYTEIAAAAQKLSADAQAIATYYAAHCHS